MQWTDSFAAGFMPRAKALMILRSTCGAIVSTYSGPLESRGRHRRCKRGLSSSSDALVKVSRFRRECPVKCEVGDILPALLATGVVTAAREQLVCCDCPGVLGVLLEILALHDRREDVVVAAGDKQQRCAIVVGK